MSENFNSLPKYEIISDEIGSFDFIYKIILIGDSSVGKSCITYRATKDSFINNYTPTVGFEFFNLYLKIKEKNIKLQIWDTCGQEKFRSLISNFYRNSSLAMIVYSIIDKESYNNIDLWLNEIKTQTSPDIKIFLIGNKTDLVNSRVIRTEKAKKFADERSLNYFIETSAKNGDNIMNAFVYAANLLLEESLKYKKMGRVNKHNLNNNNKEIRSDSHLSFNFVEDEPSNIILENNSLKGKRKCCC